MRRALDRPVTVWGGLAVWQLILGLHVFQRESSDWFIFEAFGRAVLGRGPRTPVGTGAEVLHLYARMPRFQVGPPALLLATPLQLLRPGIERPVACTVMAAAGLLVLWICASSVGTFTGNPVPTRRLLAAGLLLACPWTVLSVKYLHFDDVLTLLLLTLALKALLKGAFVAPAMLLGTAAATKPWAGVAVGLLLLVPPVFRIRCACVFAAVGLAWWLPFLLADPDTGAALLGADVPVSPSSLVAQLGFSGWSGTLFRPLQLGAATATGILLTRRRPLEVLMIVLSVRLLLDVQAWPYYWAGPAVGGALAALAGVRAGWVVLSLAAVAAAPTLLATYGVGPDILSGAAIALALVMATYGVAAGVSQIRSWRADRKMGLSAAQA